MAKRVGVAKSAAHRLVTTLVAEGLLEQNPENGRHHLGLTLFILGAEMRNRMNMSARHKPLLRAMRDSTYKTIHLAVLPAFSSADAPANLPNSDSSWMQERKFQGTTESSNVESLTRT